MKERWKKNGVIMKRIFYDDEGVDFTTRYYHEAPVYFCIVMAFAIGFLVK